jgi:hypothetical protein
MRALPLLIAILSVPVSCSRASKGPLPNRKLVGLNDTAFYHIDRKGRTVLVEKLGPRRDITDSTLQAYITLTRDTIELGQEFDASFHRGVFGLSDDPFEIIIFKPSQDTLTREDYKRLGKTDPFQYELKTIDKGLFDFEGEIRYKGTVRPFHWRFIVI